MGEERNIKNCEEKKGSTLARFDSVLFFIFVVVEGDLCVLRRIVCVLSVLCLFLLCVLCFYSCVVDCCCSCVSAVRVCASAALLRESEGTCGAYVDDEHAE